MTNNQSRPGWRATALLLSLLATLPLHAQDEEETPPWYRVELMVFEHTGGNPGGSEAWDPEPSLSYPERARFLLRPDLADLRVEEFDALSSLIDDTGVQTLTLPAPPAPRAHLFDVDLDRDTAERLVARSLEPERDDAQLDLTELLELGRPDAVIGQAAPTLPGSAETALSEPTAGDPNMPADPNAPPPAPLPFVALPGTALEFGAEASAMEQRGGYRILFHESWVQPMLDEDSSLPLVLDRSGDRDTPVWPRLQGSVKLDLSRYLHIETNLWLNTDGHYLTPGWQIDPPPRAPASLLLTYPEGESAMPVINPVPIDSEPRSNAIRDQYRSPPASALPERSSSPTPGAAAGPIDASAAPDPNEPGDAELPYQWRHAVQQTQSRRMRSNEVHYIDHPMLGVIVKFTPLEEDELPQYAPDEQLQAWRARHSGEPETLSPPTDAPAGRADGLPSNSPAQ